MNQMIAHYSFADYAKFKAAFDGHTEDRSQNGLSLLQLWREGAVSAWALYQVNDAKAAKDYLAGAAGVFNSLAGVTSVEIHLVETA